MNSAAVITGHAAVSCLGNYPAAIWRSLLAGQSGLQTEAVTGGYTCPVGRVSGLAAAGEEEPSFCALIRNSLATPPPSWEWEASDTAWILCSAKGNITALAGEEGNYSLAATAREIAEDLNLSHSPVCISTACTSSLAGIVHAVRLLRSGRYRRVAVSGGDLASDFVLSGFNRIHAVSPENCRPYDAARKGINLATAAATVYLEWRPPLTGEICVTGAATSNDGFHISRPIPSGEGLGDCIRRSLEGSTPDFICGHGTATVLNDNMESEAIHGSGLADVPVFSLKGQLGHTLGACGALETIITAYCLREGVVLPSFGFRETGTTAKINVNRSKRTTSLHSALNLAVGFGGGNAAILLQKAEA